MDLKIGSTLKTLFRRTWYQRKWVVQEVVMSKNPIVICGDESAAWSELGDRILWLMNCGGHSVIGSLG